MSKPKAYLLDVEGTVAPVSFITETLFPYAREHFEEFLRGTEQEMANLERGDTHEETVLIDLLRLLRENKAEIDPDAPRILPPEAAGRQTVSMSPAYAIPRVMEYIHWLMNHDRKSTALKSMQGKIWKVGYERGELTSKLFDDVPAALARWAAKGNVAIYSSGSVEAQKLFFRYSDHGDLTPLISGYFDTRTGPKQGIDSYRAIAVEMKVAPADVLFFSDVVRELDAAREAGCGTRLVIRPGNAPVEDACGHFAVESFTAQ
jgi:enolase-phosphatase E1